MTAGNKNLQISAQEEKTSVQSWLDLKLRMLQEQTFEFKLVMQKYLVIFSTALL